MSPITGPPGQVGRVHVIVPPPPPPPGGGGGFLVSIIGIQPRVAQFGVPMGTDRVARPKEEIESKRHEDLRVDLEALQQAIALVNSNGVPATPSFVLKAVDFDGTASGWKYRIIEHGLGFTPDRWVMTDANSPGWGDIFALRGTVGSNTFTWSDTRAYLAWPDAGTFDTSAGEVRVTFFRGE